MMKRTWLITGCSAGGIGAGIAKGVLARGENVIVTARNTEKVKEITEIYPKTSLAVSLDVTDPASMDAAIQAGMKKFGRIDVLVNNAGYAYRSSVEEAEEEGMRMMYETNLFGPIHLIQKILPVMRSQKEGTIINISSIAAARTGAASGFYASSKAALELLSEGLAKELEPLGIHVMIVEPGSFRTHFYDTSLQGSEMTISAYRDTAWTRSKANSVNARNQPGDPDRAGDVIMDVLDSGRMPMRLLLGSDAVKAVRSALQVRLDEIGEWETKSGETDF